MNNAIALGSSADVNVRVTALTTNPNVPVTYKTIILKKNFVNGVNTLTQEMMSTTNIKYVIKYDFTLAEDIIIPANCVLEFDGGSISGTYTITGTNTDIQAGLVKIFNTNIILAGTWNVAEAYPEWFDNSDNLSIQKAINYFKNVKLGAKTYEIYSPIEILTGTKLIGDSSSATIIKKKNNSLDSSSQDSILSFSSLGNSTVSSVLISNISITKETQNENSYGIFLGSCTGFIIENIIITKVGIGIGTKSSGSTYGTPYIGIFNNVQINIMTPESAYSKAIYFQDGAGYLTFNSCLFIAGIGINAKNMVYCTFNSCSISYCYGEVMRMEGCRMTTFNDLGCEDNTCNYFIYIDLKSNITFNGLSLINCLSKDSSNNAFIFYVNDSNVSVNNFNLDENEVFKNPFSEMPIYVAEAGTNATITFDNIYYISNSHAIDTNERIWRNLGDNGSVIRYNFNKRIFINKPNSQHLSFDDSVYLSKNSDSLPSDIPIGVNIFIKDKNKPYWYNGTNWVDATGATI